MTKSLHIQGLPETFHRRLVERAAAEEVSVSEYVFHAVERALDNPKLSLKEEKRAMKEALAELMASPPLGDDPEPSRVLLEEREMRRKLDEKYRREGLEERRKRSLLSKRKSAGLKTG